jgi:two-component system, NarL family, response regulator YdfI
VLRSNPQLTVVGSVSDLDALLGEVQLQPQVVLLDLSGNLQQSVWEKLLLIQEEQYPSPIMVIADELDSINLEVALRSGVRGILPDTSTESEIIAAVEAIALGLIVLHPDAVELLSLKESMREKVALTPMQTLTPREIEVLEMLGSGLGNKAIALGFAYLRSHRQVSCLIHIWQEPGFRLAATKL